MHYMNLLFTYLLTYSDLIGLLFYVKCHSGCLHRRWTSLMRSVTVRWCRANWNVVSRRLKAASVEFELRTWSGKLFRADGPAMMKARGRPYVLSRWHGTCSRFHSAERRCLWLDSGTQWTARYWGARSFSHWSTIATSSRVTLSRTLRYHASLLQLLVSRLPECMFTTTTLGSFGVLAGYICRQSCKYQRLCSRLTALWHYINLVLLLLLLLLLLLKCLVFLLDLM